jgi:hypothetical protein
MIEHLAIADLGALLIVVGLTGPVLAPILRIGLFDRLRVLAHPLVALPLWAIDLVAWHVPVLHNAALHHDGVHALQHLCFIFFGANVWMCLFGPLPKPTWFGTGWKAGYIVIVRLVGAALANAFLFGGDAFYSAYAAGERAHGISGTDDQVVAGAIMMIEESLLTIGLFCWLFLRAARENDERQELLDLAAERGVELGWSGRVGAGASVVVLGCWWRGRWWRSRAGRCWWRSVLVARALMALTRWALLVALPVGGQVTDGGRRGWRCHRGLLSAGGLGGRLIQTYPEPSGQGPAGRVEGLGRLSRDMCG